MALTEKCADSTSTLHDLHTGGLPNAFIMSISQSGFMPNSIHTPRKSRVCMLRTLSVRHIMVGFVDCIPLMPMRMNGPRLLSILPSCTPGFSRSICWVIIIWRASYRTTGCETYRRAWIARFLQRGGRPATRGYTRRVRV